MFEGHARHQIAFNITIQFTKGILSYCHAEMTITVKMLRDDFITTQEDEAVMNPGSHHFIRCTLLISAQLHYSSAIEGSP